MAYCVYQRRAKAVVEVAAMSAMKMVEGSGDGEVERWWMWQWTAALTRLMLCSVFFVIT